MKITHHWRGTSALARTAAALTATALLAACSGTGGSAPSSSVLPTQSHSQSSINPDTTAHVYGGGSSLAALLYRTMFDYYGVALPPDTQGNGVPVNSSEQYYYGSIGSGGGQYAFLSQTPATATPVSPPIYCSGGVTTCWPYPRWDFSGSDATLNSTQISCYQSGGSCGSSGPVLTTAVQPVRGQYVQLPSFETDVTMAYNPSGQTVPAGGLQLSRNSYCGIWEGAITSWGDPGITADNGGVQVSTQPITRVVRSDGSGTTFLLTNHLNTVCQGLANPAYDWTGGVGTTVTWPGTVASGNGSGGVVSTTTSTPGGIGYVGPSYVAPVVSGGLPTASLQNQWAIRNGVTHFVGPTVASTLAALNATTPPVNPDPYDLAVLIPNPNTEKSYPVVGFTWLEIYQCYKYAGQKNGIQGFVDWLAQSGTTGTTPPDKILEAQGEGPLPPAFKAKEKSIIGNLHVAPVSGTCTD